MTSAPLSPVELGLRIAALPRERLAVLPTGVHELRRLGRQLGGGHLYVKRDDLTGIALGGNKSRAMEFILGDARASGCDVLVAGGGVEQSNHAVQCAASANRAGLEAVLVLQRRSGARSNGNALLRELIGGRTIWMDADPEIHDRMSAGATMRQVADELVASGRHPYVLESSLHPLSVIGYVEAARELNEQLPSTPEAPLRVYITSEGSALGGLLLGSRVLGLSWEVIGLDWRPQEQGTTGVLQGLTDAAASRLGLANPLQERDITILPTGGPAYGVGNTESWAALSMLARLEGLVLDPVYTAKGMAGALDDLRRRPLPPEGRAVFVHTGGIPATFAYEPEIHEYLKELAR